VQEIAVGGFFFLKMEDLKHKNLYVYLRNYHQSADFTLKA
jgi:hypothetical protein